MSSSPRPVVLVVVDGFGHRAADEANAVALARMPVWKGLWARSPRTLLEASG
ncbi:MAG: 2,3-bisphosphoglycerate-independent phosphoglycerate mutase, partial [Gemmatimonadetes bacterium]|nr:2,3-bisphosphoglycerate-independent phosphoglycerate mutase [Gemmatimonadota bacterium]